MSNSLIRCCTMDESWNLILYHDNTDGIVDLTCTYSKTEGTDITSTKKFGLGMEAKAEMETELMFKVLRYVA